MTTWRAALGLRDHQKLVGTRFRELWLPDLNSFHLPSVLPGFFFLVRTHGIRGRGRWASTFGTEGDPQGTPRSVARRLLVRWGLDGPHPEDSPGEDVLADWLAQELLVVKQGRGTKRRDRKVMGIQPLHTILLRADLPREWANTRGVPLLLAKYLCSEGLEKQLEKQGLHDRDRRLLEALGPGIRLDERTGQDTVDFGGIRDLDQRLAAAVADALGELPSTATKDLSMPTVSLTPRGSASAWDLVGRFIQAFAGAMPGRVFTRQFLALTSAVLTREFLAHLETVLHGWATGDPVEQRPRVLVDLSDGRHRYLVQASRRSFRQVAERLRQYMVPFAGLRLAWHVGGNQPDSRTRESIRELFRLARALRQPEDGASREVLLFQGAIRDLRQRVREAATDVLADEQAQIFRQRLEEGSILDALARAVADEIGGSGYGRKARDFLRGCAGYNLPVGLLKGPESDRSRHSAPYWRLSDELLEALVHAWTWPLVDGQWVREPLSVGDFVQRLERELGLVLRPTGDPGLGRENEIRLRDRLAGLGLFRSVSDAERMQRLKPVFRPKEVLA